LIWKLEGEALNKEDPRTYLAKLNDKELFETYSS
jgi:hypothetical protein